MNIKIKNKNKQQIQTKIKKSESDIQAKKQKIVSKILNQNVKPKHDYAGLLTNPTRTLSTKVPKFSMGRSFAFRRVVGYTTPLTNTNGAFIHFIPESIGSTLALTTPFLFDNQATYNPTTGASVAIVPIVTNTQFNLNVNNVDNIRVVAAGLKMWVTDSALNLKGNMYAMVESTPFSELNTGSATNAPQAAHPLTYVQRAEHIDAPICHSSEGIIYNWRPRSTDSFEPYPLNNYATLRANSQASIDKFTCILTGFPATATLNVLLYYHFEVTPDVNGEYAEFPSYCTNITDPWDVVTPLSIETSLWLREGSIKEDGGHNAHSAITDYLLKGIPDKNIAGPKTNEIDKLVSQYTMGTQPQGLSFLPRGLLGFK
jgi:hypothetical protein